jgi:hypothetical protein
VMLAAAAAGCGGSSSSSRQRICQAPLVRVSYTSVPAITAPAAAAGMPCCSKAASSSVGIHSGGDTVVR